MVVVPRSGSPKRRRGRRGTRRTWITVDGAPVAGERGLRPGDDDPAAQARPDPATAPEPAGATAPPHDEVTPPHGNRPVPGRNAGGPSDDPRRYEPRRRYPWHDDPDYDPAAHRRPPPPAQPWSPPPPPPGQPGPPPPTSPPGHPPDRAARPMPTGTGPAGPFGAGPTGTGPTGTGPTGTGPRAAPPHPPGAADDAAGQLGEPAADGSEQRPPRRVPRKLTVTRVAALRSREITENGIRAFRRAATADGAERSGLTALTYATMMTYAVDAAVAVALANTLFFAAATAESRTNVALYLAITVAPFAVVAPVIGPLLDRLQRGRRAALAASFGGRAVLAVVMAFNYDNWLLYPAALGVMVLSKSFVVLKAAVTPRVLPSAITLVTTNSRLTAFGLASGTVFGGVAAGFAALLGSPGALFFTAALGVVGVVLCLRIPAWVEVTAGEVPAALRSTARGRREPMGRRVLVALWGNGSLRALTGFLTLFVAFVIKAQAEEEPARQLLLIGIVGAAGGIGAFAGNAVGSRHRFRRSDTVVLTAIGVAVAAAATAALVPGIGTAAAAALIAGTCSALAKVCLDAVMQRDLPEASRASAFGRSETVLQLSWVFGGALGVLLPHSTYWIGFTVIACVVALGGLQAALLRRGRSLLPFLGPRGGQDIAQPVRTG
jgi:MFS family permease